MTHDGGSKPTSCPELFHWKMVGLGKALWARFALNLSTDLVMLTLFSQMMQTPSHVLPSVTSLCSSFLQSLLVSKHTSQRYVRTCSFTAKFVVSRCSFWKLRNNFGFFWIPLTIAISFAILSFLFCGPGRASAFKHCDLNQARPYSNDRQNGKTQNPFEVCKTYSAIQRIWQ